MILETKGAVISLKDNISSIYNEYLIGFEMDNLMLENAYLYTDVLNKYRADKQFESDKQIASIFLSESSHGLIKDRIFAKLNTYEQVVKFRLQALYFNNKSFN